MLSYFIRMMAWSRPLILNDFMGCLTPSTGYSTGWVSGLIPGIQSRLSSASVLRSEPSWRRNTIYIWRDRESTTRTASSYGYSAQTLERT